jgi:hypothetical protein
MEVPHPPLELEKILVDNEKQLKELNYHLQQ